MNSTEEVCAKYPNITVAKDSDNQEILDFLKSVSMNLKDGKLDFDRDPNYFKLHSIQGIVSKTFLFRNKDGSLVGIGVLTAVRGLYQGKETVWAYSSDLRFSPKMDKVTKLQFRPWYSDLVKNIKTLQDLHCPEFMLSIVLDDNEMAKKTLLNRNNPVIYRPVYKYQTRAVVGKLPTLKRSPKVTNVSSGNIAELKKFIQAEQSLHSFSFSLLDIEQKLKTLNQTWEDFVIVMNKENQIIAAAFPTSDNEFRKTVAHIESKRMKMIGLLSRLLGRPAIPQNGVLKTSILAFTTYKNSLTSEEKETLHKALLTKAWSMNSQNHVMVTTEEQKPKAMNRVFEDGLLCHFVPGTVYQIIHKDDYKKENLLRGMHKKSFHLETSFL